jgi:hypothetical protein
VGGPGRPRALVAVSRVAPDIVIVRLDVRTDDHAADRRSAQGFRHVSEDERILGA